MVQHNKLNTEDPQAENNALHPRSFTCFNALKHGATSKAIYIEGEDPSQLEALMDEAFFEHKPSTGSHAALVADSVQARWMLWRRQRAHFDLEQAINEKAGHITAFTEADFHTLNLLDRYKTQAERAFQRALANLRAVRKDELAEEKTRELLAIQREKLARERETFETAKAERARAAEESKKSKANLHKMLNIERKLKEYDTRDGAPPLIEFAEKLDCHVIAQRAFIAIDSEGQTEVVSIEPSNDEVREIIERAGHYQNEPKQVLRTFKFYDGLPPEYEFLLDGEIKLPNDKSFACLRSFPFEVFQHLADMEDGLAAFSDDCIDEE